MVKISRKGDEVKLGGIRVGSAQVNEYDFTNSQYKLAEKISAELSKLKRIILSYLLDLDKDWKIGWLSPIGRHYICNYGEHSALAYSIGCSESDLERDGFVKVASDDEDGYFRGRCPMSAEQRNWLSMHGYFVE